MKKETVHPIRIEFLALLLTMAVVLMACVKKANKNETFELDSEVSVENEERISRATKEGKASIILSNTKAKPGDKVKLIATIVNNPGILGMSMTLSYDENIMKLINVENGEAVKDVLTLSYSSNLKSGCVFLWDGEDIESEQVQEGEILVLEFQIAESVPEGKTPLLLVSDEDGIVDRELQVVDIDIDNGFITIVQ